MAPVTKTPKTFSRTAASEGFFRTRSTVDANQTAQVSTSMTTDNDTSAATSSNTNESPRTHHPHASSLSAPRRGDGLKSFNAMHKTQLSPKPSFLMDPNDSYTNDSAASTPTQTIRMRNFPQGSRRSFSARSMTMTDAALAAIKFDNQQQESDRLSTNKKGANLKQNALLCSMCYNGMDVLFATTSKNKVMAISARTRVPFQYLDLPFSSENRDVTIVSLIGNPLTGLVLVTLSNGDIHTFIPREAPVLGEFRSNHNEFSHYRSNHNPHKNYHQSNHHMHSAGSNTDNSYIPPSAFGQFRWCSEQIIYCFKFFDVPPNQGNTKIEFARKKNRKEAEGIGNEVQLESNIEDDISDIDDESDDLNEDDYKSYVHVSCCRMNKVLVAYRDQMAVFQVNDAPTLHAGAAAQILSEGELLWITHLHKQVLHAQLSGDGNAIAVVVEGEGEGVPFPFGVRTFLRDKEDGSFILNKRLRSVRDTDISGTNHINGSFDSADAPTTEKDITMNRKHKSPLAVGIVYKAGPFLKHSQPVTRISWRGGGSSSLVLDGEGLLEGNDLLLTHCKEDSSTRIFSQSGMKQLIQWHTPPGSRADWIAGVSSANLGDLDSSKKDKDAADEEGMWSKKKMSRESSSSFLSTLEESGTSLPSLQALSHHPNLSSGAGAWIAELTFRGAYPAFRLSRLSYVQKGGDKYHAAHFESVAAILPAGTLIPKAILEGEEESFSVQGFWPVWKPWTRGASDSTLGNHSPPSELRIIASHTIEDRATLLEFPLWGDKDVGAMEFGSPLKYVLLLSDLAIGENLNNRESQNGASEPHSLEFESSRLVAQIALGGQSVGLTWHREGSMSILPSMSNKYTPTILASPSSKTRRSLPLQAIPEKDTIRKYIDISVTQLPIELPPVRNNYQGHIVHLGWWPDENYGGPPRLLLLNSDGTIILFEMPPPWSALEPPMPVSFESIDKSVVSQSEIYDQQFDDRSLGSDTESIFEEREEYEVKIKPHPDFGIGLRLEAQAEGLPAIAGSYKKHPLTGGRLPAEKIGMIRLGDELLAVNNVSLEGATFDDIISIVRKVGSSSKGELLMRFRPGRNRERLLLEAIEMDQSDLISLGSTGTAGSKRRSILNLQQNNLPSSDIEKPECDGSVVTMMVGAEGEKQQEFCRVVAMSNCAIPGEVTALLLLPWHYGTGAPNLNSIRGAALIITCSGRSLTASRLEVTNDLNPEKSKHFILGSVELIGIEDTENVNIQSLTYVKTASEGWCLAACDDCGRITLVFIDVEQIANSSEEQIKKNESSLRAVFKQYQISDALRKPDNKSSYLLRAHSVQLMATMPKSEPSSNVTVWLALPRPYLSSPENRDLGYKPITVSINPKDTILDIRWLTSGNLDAFPWLVTFSRRSVIVHQRPGGELKWVPVAELTYPSIMGYSPHTKRPHMPKSQEQTLLYSGHLNPTDAYPHMISALREIIESCDERRHVRSDWHPDSILASICTETKGTNIALKKHVKGLFKWLSQWMSPDSASRPQWNAYFNLEIAPLRVVQDDSAANDVLEEEYEQEEEKIETAASLFSKMTTGGPKAKNEQSSLPTEAELLIFELQASLRAHQKVLEKKRMSDDSAKAHRSKEFILAMSQLNTEDSQQESGEIPAPLKNLNEDEVLFLWAMGDIITNPPKITKLDTSSQLTMFSLTLLRTLEKFHESGEDGETQIENFNRKKESFAASSESGLAQPPGIASGACLSALLSNTQIELLSSCHVSNMKMDWPTARAIRLPFWLRDDTQLVSIAEEIGQQTFKSTKEVMECALFYVAMGKNLKLQTMARADRTNSGQKLFKFLSNFDFSSERGRKAAEKNAYSLLRKRQYGVAAAFFLLPKPPMLTTALEVIVTQMEDLTLGFFIARLVEYSRKNDGASNLGGLSLNGGMLNGFGNQGGFMGNAKKEETPFHKWTPSLGSGAKTMLENRGLPITKDDPCFEAVLLCWLNKPFEAAKYLAGNTKTPKDNEECNFDLIVPPSFSVKNTEEIFVPCLSPPLTPATKSSERVIIKSNLLISFCSAPFLLKRFNTDKRLLWSSTLHVARALSRRGVELSSVQMLLQYTDSSDYEEKKDLSRNDATKVPQLSTSNTKSIFDSFDPPPRPKPTVDHMQSSIFDSFDAPPRTKPMTDPMQSSIFDSFDAPPRPKPVSDPIQSSIFDSFDAPPRPKPVSDPMQSSIFDSFDAPPPTETKKPTQKEGASSIFDSFETAPQRPQPKSNSASQNGQMTSSIFDSYTAPISNKKENLILNPKESSKTNDICSNQKSEENLLPLPPLWNEWREYNMAKSVARRLIREMARVVSKFHGEATITPMNYVRKNRFPLAPAFATEVFQNHCEGDLLLNSVQECLDHLCDKCQLEADAVVEQALLLLGCPGLPRRIVFAVLLHRLMNRADLAEDIIRDAAQSQMRSCEVFAFSNDNLVHERKTVFHNSSLFVRRKAARISWQLELCLWLYRGGVLPLSGIAVKETVIAVRIGFLIASWGRCHDTLESLIKCTPDCAHDPEQGRQLWTSMKMMNCDSETNQKNNTKGSGGWEFLVDCRRDEATNLLRDRRPGSFLLRPHPEDHGVFTLSFKTNLLPSIEKETSNDTSTNSTSSNSRPVSADDVVQHAIVRLSDSGFRCGSFGPFPSLIKLLEEVSSSLPFKLLFDEPPAQGIIKDQGDQPSPNAFLLRKLALNATAEHSLVKQFISDEPENDYDFNVLEEIDVDSTEFRLRKQFGLFTQVLILSEIRKQLSALAIADFEEPPVAESSWHYENEHGQPFANAALNESLLDNPSKDEYDYIEEDMHGVASRMLRPFLQWCQTMEALLVPELAPCQDEYVETIPTKPIDVDVSDMAINASDTAIEAAYPGSTPDGGDAMIRSMIQPGSGVAFRTLRVGEGINSAVIVLFSKSEAISWLATKELLSENNAEERLRMMEKAQVIEEINIEQLMASNQGKHFTLGASANSQEMTNEVCYRFIDPWEVEILESREDEGKGASLGRERLLPFNIGSVASCCEQIQRDLGGVQLLSLWSSTMGGIFLTKAIASMHPPRERDSGSDLTSQNGNIIEPSSYLLSLEKRLYRNAMFRRLRVPQRFVSLVQVELLDLKNLTAPGGSPPLNAFALLKLKRDGSTSPLTLKARPLDSACTRPKRISRSSGPNAPASWGTLVRFRFALPENVDFNCKNNDPNTESLFKGPPSVLQLTVYEKKFMSDLLLGDANVKLDALKSGGQLEEWVPLRSNKDGINW